MKQVYEIAEGARDYLSEHYKPETSFYEEMLHRQEQAKAVEKEKEQKEIVWMRLSRVLLA